jgi:hypothetical protein
MVQARSPISKSSRSAAARIALPAQDEDIAALRRVLVAKLTYAVGKDPIVASDRDWFVATALTVRDRIVDRWMPSTRAIYAQGRKRVCQTISHRRWTVVAANTNVKWSGNALCATAAERRAPPAEMSNRTGGMNATWA